MFKKNSSNYHFLIFIFKSSEQTLGHTQTSSLAASQSNYIKNKGLQPQQCVPKAFI